MWPSWWPGGAKRRKCVPLRTHDTKKEPGGSPKLQKVVPRLEKTWKMVPRRCQKETRRQKWVRKITRRSKNTPEQHNRAAGAPKAQTAHKKKHKMGNTTARKSKIMRAIIPMRVRSPCTKNKDPLHKKTRAFPPYSRKSGRVPGAQEKCAPLPSKWGGLPLSYIYIYIPIRPAFG